MADYVKAIGIDFDGVIHSNDKGWNSGLIEGEPIKGSIESLNKIMQTHAVFIYTARTDLQSVANWLTNYDFQCVIEHDDLFWRTQGTLLITNKKYVAVAYIDDRAIQFTDWNSAMAAFGELY